MKSVAIITARGGSKRIPRKNIKEFCGRPIIEYSIRAALESGVFDEVMVSTDDEEIAAVARAAGAEVPFMRTADTANDFATTADVLKEVLEQYAQEGKEFDVACCIYPTAPFVTAGRLRSAIEKLIETNADSVVPIVRFDFPPQRGVIIEQGFLKFKWPQYMSARSQDLEPLYHDVGQFYCLRVSSFQTQNNLVMEKTVPLVISELEAQDIDTQEDWENAEMKYQLMRKGKTLGYTD